MTKFVFQLLPGDVFYAPPVNKWVQIQQILDEGFGSEVVFETDSGVLSGNPYESVTIPTEIIKLEVQQ